MAVREQFERASGGLVRREADCFSGERGFHCESGGSWAVLYVQVVPLPPVSSVGGAGFVYTFV